MDYHILAIAFKLDPYVKMSQHNFRSLFNKAYIAWLKKEEEVLILADRKFLGGSRINHDTCDEIICRIHIHFLFSSVIHILLFLTYIRDENHDFITMQIQEATLK
ncbi:uncharacterized protein DS421_9g281940 [Arachis hypogaea]|nr:uncharacterized protein DS421_9g281940 [Arachis hypogaea]